ncbi:MAG: HDIG domain-containing protein [Spirochaetales bacterium]|nr:HDIG domain-containing protein [Spirochaetales bacterium]
MKTYRKIHNFKQPGILPSWITNTSYYRWLFIILSVSTLFAFLIILISTYLDLPFSQVRISDYKLNEKAPYDFIVSRDIVYVDVKATKAAREANANKVFPIFELNSDITKDSFTLFQNYMSILAENAAKKASPEKVLNEIQINLPKAINIFGKNEITALLPLFLGNEEVIESARNILEEAMKTGIFHRLEEMITRNPELFSEGKIDLWQNANQHEEIFLEKALSLNNIQDWIEYKTKKLPYNEVNKSLIILLVSSFAMENTFYNRVRTEENRKKARESVKPVMQELKKNYPIVRKGDIVTEESLEQIRVHGESDISLNINNIIGNIFTIIIVMFLVLTLLNRQIIQIRLKKNRILLLTGTFFFFLILITLLSKIPASSSWLPFSVWLPVSTIAIIISLLITPAVGLIFSLIISITLLFMTKMNVDAFVFSLITGLSGCFIALKIRKRIDIILAGLFLALYSSFILLTIGFIRNFTIDELWLTLVGGVFNGFLYGGILSIGALTLLEHVLNAATQFRLLELSDLNAPTFKKMLNVAPGTYNHSIIMANLAEMACTEIDANALLARVGAYYHDIGKLDQPEYFIENQTSDNVHDDLKPSLSVAVIKSHVKIGIEKAKELKLPQEVIDIIAQHHGKGLITYFYQRAINENGKVSPDDFRYPGERPKSKEAAIVMLADIVEAASRTLKRPTVNKLEKLVWKIIMDKFSADELSECNLTLNELEMIKNSFVRALTGHFHSRIEYPKVKENVR